MRSSILKFYKYFIKKQKLLFSLIFTLGLVTWPLDLVLIPYFNKLFVDRVSSSKDINFILKPLILIFVIKAVANILNRTYDVVWLKFITKFKSNVRRYLLSYIQNHSHGYFTKRMSGSIAKRAIDLSNHSEPLLMFFNAHLFPMLFAMVLTIYLTYKISFLFSIIFMLWFALDICLAMSLSSKAIFFARIKSTKMAALSGNFIDSISNMINVKMFGAQISERKYLDKFEEEEVLAHQNVLLQSVKIRSTINLVDTLVFLFFFILLFNLYKKGEVTLGDFMLIYGFYHNFGRSVSMMGRRISDMFNKIGESKDHLDTLLSDYGVVDSENAKNLKLSEGKISFKNIYFKYGDKEVISNLNLNIGKREKIGIVGASGAGKSSLLTLVVRFYDFDGKIEIDGQDIQKTSQNSLRKHISYVMQDSMLFNRSIKENISYGKPNATFKDIQKAAKLASIDEFINTLKEGYDTVVGERGIKLSGGQRQRISIARALLKDSPILLMDEATSSLDSETEKAIQDSLKYLIKDKSVIVVAHRLSTISKMDRLVVMDKGKVVEEGTHSQLISKKGIYAKLWKMQSDGFIS